jgi:hypothetical protein
MRRGDCLLGMRYGWWWVVLLPLAFVLRWLWEMGVTRQGRDHRSRLQG